MTSASIATEDAFGRPSPIGRTNGANGDYDAEKDEADVHLNHYVMDQLSRVRTGESDTAIYEDEFEAQLDN